MGNGHPRPAFRRAALVVCISLAASAATAADKPTAPTARHFDLLIRNGLVVDGSGEPGYIADVAVSGDQIVAMGALSSATATRVVDAGGRIVAPGFIDLHTHVADAEEGYNSLLSSDPRRRAAQNYVAQGVTTALSNPDGNQEMSLHDQRRLVQSKGIGINLALTNGHNGLREMVMGKDQQRPANASEIRRMQEILRNDMENEGSFGLSLGVEYYSGRYSTADEQLELARVLPAYNGIFIPHLRSQGIAPMWYLPSANGDKTPPTLDDSIDETLRVAHESGATVVFTHMKAWGPGFRGQGERIVARLQAARDRGDRVFMDVYPYDSSASDGNFLAIPRWAFGKEDARGIDYRAAFAATMSKEKEADLARDIRHAISLKGGVENIVVLTYPNPSYVGKRLSELMALRKLDEVDLVLALQREGNPRLAGGAQMRSFSMDDEDIKTFYRQSWTTTSTDGWVVLPEEAVGEKKYRNTNRRLFGSYPRRLTYYSQEAGVDTLEHAIRSMTGLPAKILNLADRGQLAVGMKADITVLDMKRLRDNTTYLEPSVYPDGIEYVLVNGSFVVDAGRRTLALPGRMLSPAGSKLSP